MLQSDDKWLQVAKTAIYQKEAENLENRFEMKRISGLSNTNFRIDTGEKGQENMYLLKVLNSSNDFFVSRKLENEILGALRACKLSPDILEEGPQYRIQEFIPGEQLTTQELLEGKETHRKAAVDTISTFHSKLTPLLPNLLKEDPMIVRFLKKLPQIHTKICTNLKEVNIPEKQLLLDTMSDLLKDRDSHLDFLSSFAGSVMICHNDLNLTNFIKLSRPEDIQRFELQILLIDMEYAGPNFLHWEIANFLHELNCEYPEDDPYFVMNEDTENMLELKLDLISQFYRKYGDLVKQTEDQFKECCLNFQMFALYYWLWLCMNDSPGGWPGTETYVKAKLARYYFYKSKLFKQ